MVEATPGELALWKQGEKELANKTIRLRTNCSLFDAKTAFVRGVREDNRKRARAAATAADNFQREAQNAFLDAPGTPHDRVFTKMREAVRELITAVELLTREDE